MLGGLFRKKRQDEAIPVEKLTGEIWIVQGYRLGEKWSLEEGEIRVGRSVEEQEGIRPILFPENAKFISSEHSSFTKEKDGYYVTDLGSKNGTYVNGKRIKRHRLHHGDDVEIGQVTFKVRITSPEIEKQWEEREGEVEVVNGPLKGEKFTLDHGDVIIGRAIEGDGVISFPESETHVSSEHSVLKKQKGSYWVQDLNSKNGTYVNGKLRTMVELKDGDEINIGDVVFKVHIRRKG